MLSDIVNNVIALAVGLVTGFYFERRSTRSAQDQAREAEAAAIELREELRTTRMQLLGRHGTAQAAAPPVETEIRQKVLGIIREFQDASGQTSTSTVRNQMTMRGIDVAVLAEVIELLVETGEVTRSGSTLQVNA